MSSQEEGDYVDMSGLVFTYFSLYILNKDILLLLINNFISGMCCLSWVILFLVGKPFILCFRTTGHREASPQPSTSGVSKER